MKYENMNPTQKLISLISGYDGDYNGARDDGYYDQNGSMEKLIYLAEVADSHDDVPFDAHIYHAFVWLDTHFGDEADRWHGFMALGKY